MGGKQSGNACIKEYPTSIIQLRTNQHTFFIFGILVLPALSHLQNKGRKSPLQFRLTLSPEFPMSEG